mmetsp:Transcript_13170/g.26798  ORF Transcript_13170/g.26798 Transcript_13170/m.26798 type:complete len:83 (-) Transcript_13170:968-1216(-)
MLCIAWRRGSRSEIEPRGLEANCDFKAKAFSRITRHVKSSTTARFITLTSCLAAPVDSSFSCQAAPVSDPLEGTNVVMQPWT